MSFWKKRLLDFINIILFIALYYFIGFELTVIIGLAQISSNLSKTDVLKKPSNLPVFYTNQKRR